MFWLIVVRVQSDCSERGLAEGLGGAVHQRGGGVARGGGRGQRAVQQSRGGVARGGRAWPERAVLQSA